MAYTRLAVPRDVECVAEVCTSKGLRGRDGDVFDTEAVDLITQRCLAQAEYVSIGSITFERYNIRVVPRPSTRKRPVSSDAVLRIYASPQGLMHCVNNNPYSPALSFPLSHAGENPEHDFFARHPAPHALGFQLYVTSPLCRRLAINSTVVFGVCQHPPRLIPVRGCHQCTWPVRACKQYNGFRTLYTPMRGFYSVHDQHLCRWIHFFRTKRNSFRCTHTVSPWNVACLADNSDSEW